MVQNAPHDEIPDNAVAYIRNAHCFPKEFRSRLGCNIYSTLKPPALTGRTGYTARQTGDIITATADIFEEGDVSNFWVWPGDHDFHTEIQEVISATQIRVGDSLEQPSTSKCWMHGRLNLWQFHEGESKIVFQWGKKVYVANDLELTSWTEALCVSYDEPSNTISDWGEMDEYGVIFNSNGIYALTFKTDPPQLFKKNDSVPTVLVERDVDGDNHRYDYLYAMSRLAGVGLRTRWTAEILQETGTTAIDLDVSRDYGTHWTEDPIDITNPNDVRVLNVPKTRPWLTDRAWQWTHYTVYRTTDIGPDGDMSRTGTNGEELAPIRFTHVRDVRVAGAFYATRECSGIVVAQVGEFELDDAGTPLVWEDGEVDTIYEYIDAQTVRVSSHEYDYYCEFMPLRACAIGGGRVMRASQEGDVVTRTAGATFTAAGVRKTIHWADGVYSIIVEYIDEDNVRVHNTATRVVQGLTIDPVARIINDYTTDKELRDRQRWAHVGLLTRRWWGPIPNCNLGALLPGFLVAAQMNTERVYYSQWTPELPYQTGHYRVGKQMNDKIGGAIQVIEKAPNRVNIFCKNSTWGGATDQPTIVEIPEAGESFSLLFVDVVDRRIGCVDIGSIQEVDNGVFEMRCSDGTWRQFDGFRYTNDLSVVAQTGQDIVKTDMQLAWSAGSSAYADKNLGHIYWMTEKPK